MSQWPNLSNGLTKARLSRLDLISYLSLSVLAIAITDKTHHNYERLDREWPASNPRGYAEWFKKRMETRLLREALKANIENVPGFKIRTPLQRVIQLLKRHRDFMFAEDKDNKPISIIITTLAAHAYNNEIDILDTLVNIVNDMPNHIESRDGVSWVPNPVNPLENFADKWEKDLKLEQNFRLWLQQVQADLNTILKSRDIHAIGKILKPRFGERVVDKALKEFPQTNTEKATELVHRSSQIPARFNVPHRQSPKWPEIQRGQVAISATASRNGFRPHQIQSASEPLSKRCSLRFEAKTNIAQPYKVYWQVVNTGHEARAANGLRGGFYDGIEKGGRIREESTLYTGMHWIECFIIKNGICVARSGEFVVNIE